MAIDRTGARSASGRRGSAIIRARRCIDIFTAQRISRFLKSGTGKAEKSRIPTTSRKSALSVRSSRDSALPCGRFLASEGLERARGRPAGAAPSRGTS